MKRMLQLFLYLTALLLCLTGAAMATEADGDTTCTEHVYNTWVAEGDYHYAICDNCQEPSPEGKAIHLINCEYNTACVICSSTEIANARYYHYYQEYQFDASQHWIYCTECQVYDDYAEHSPDVNGECLCGATGLTREPCFVHWVPCTNPSVCPDCGTTGLTANDSNVSVQHYNGKWESDAASCWFVCFDCGDTGTKKAHQLDCQTKVCANCGSSGVEGSYIHYVVDYSVWETGETEHWHVCIECSEIFARTPHLTNCTSPNGPCVCGVSGDGYEFVTLHNLDRTQLYHDDTQHWYSCGDCGEPGNKFAHSYTEGVCACGYEEPVGCSHNYVTTTVAATCTSAGYTKTVCSKCGDVLSSSSTPALGHSYSEVTVKAGSCTEDGLVQTVCSLCGSVQSSTTVEATGHDRWFTVPTVATCTTTGVRQWYCNVCGINLDRETIPAKGHDLSTTETDEAIVESCSRCNYENVTVKATATPEPTAEPTPAPTAEPTVEPTAEPTVEPTVAPVELPEDVVEVPVEDAVVEVEMDADEETVASITIAVNEVALEETPVELPLPEEVEPAKVITVQAIIPEDLAAKAVVPTKVTVTLPVTEADAAALANTKLVLVLSDSTMIEIPYELVDGQLIFTTTQTGVFAFIPVE